MNRLNSRTIIAAAALASTAAVAAGPAQAEYPDRNITVIVPSSAGGGFDLYARALGREMEKFLPDGVKVVPKNVTGAGGRKGATAAYRARPDGYTFAVFNLPGIVLPAVLGTKVGYDLDKINWLGSMAFDQYTVVVKKGSKLDSVAAMKAAGRPIKMTGYGITGIAATRLFCAAAQINCTLIGGYKGNAAALLAVIRGDGDASLGIISTVANFADSGDLQGVVVNTEKPQPALPGVPTAGAAGYPELASFGLMRAFGIGPGVKKNVLSKLQGVYDKAIASPGLAAWAKKAKRNFNPIDGAELKRVLTAQRALLTKHKAALKAKK